MMRNSSPAARGLLVPGSRGDVRLDGAGRADAPEVLAPDVVEITGPDERGVCLADFAAPLQSTRIERFVQLARRHGAGLAAEGQAADFLNRAVRHDHAVDAAEGIDAGAGDGDLG